jgi:hypothetical protein
MAFSISGEGFTTDFFALPLAGYDIVLCTQWLASLGLILWDFGALTALIPGAVTTKSAGRGSLVQPAPHCRHARATISWTPSWIPLLLSSPSQHLCLDHVPGTTASTLSLVRHRSLSGLIGTPPPTRTSWNASAPPCSSKG